MSKLNLRLNYKNALAAKHSIAKVIKIQEGEMWKHEHCDLELFTPEEYKKFLKEYEGNKRAYEAISKEIDKIRKRWKVDIKDGRK